MQPQNPIDPNAQPNNSPTYGAQPQAQGNVFPQPTQQPIAQPTVQPTYQQQYAAPQSQLATEDPGKTFSILGICLFIIPIIGISLSIVGMMKSKNSGYTGKLGQIGIITNIVSLVLGLVLFVVLPFVLTKNTVDNFNAGLTSSTSQLPTVTQSAGPGLAVGMSKADVSKALGMEPVGCIPVAGGKSESCTYRNGSGASNNSTLVSAFFTDGKLTRATGFTDNTKTIKVGS